MSFTTRLPIACRSLASARWWWPGAGLLLAIAHATGAQAAGASASSETPPHTLPSQAPTGNRIEVTGNTASGVRCANGGAVSVNSVNVNAASLKGRTVVIQGQNEGPVKQTDCADQPNKAGPASTQINSITIR